MLPDSHKLNPLKVFVTLLCAGLLALSSCQKERNFLGDEIIMPIPASCELQTDNPDGRSYSGHSLVPVSYSKNNCGLIPLSSKNYWVYKDSVYTDGNFSHVQIDTLRYVNTWKTNSDGLIWWGGSINVGIPDILYSSDSALFGLQDRMFNGPTIIDARKDFSLFAGDTLLYLANFDDIAAMGKSIKLHSGLKTPAGTFDDCIYFEKNAITYRRDRVIIKPFVGVVKYISEEAPMGEMALKMQKIMTLISYHIE